MTAANRHAETRREIHHYWRQAADGWKRWEHSLAAFLGPVTQQMLAAARPIPGERVLDVASGIGDPALQFAAAVAPGGKVLGVDLTAEMLDTARARARALGLENVSFVCGAAEDLDVPDASFDLVVCRFGVFFFPDIGEGLQRLRRLLKPGGRLCLGTWTPPEQNPAFAIPSRAIRGITGAPPPPPETPGPFRLAQDGELAAALADAGFTSIAETAVRLYQFAPNAEMYWQMLLDMSASFRAQHDALAATDQAGVRTAVIAAITSHACDGVIRVPALARVSTAIKQ